MIFTKYSINRINKTQNGNQLYRVRLISGSDSFSIETENCGYDLRWKQDRKQLAKSAVEMLNEKNNTNEFIEVF
jgi:hypothetical protein